MMFLGVLGMPAYTTDNASDNLTIPYTFSAGETTLERVVVPWVSEGVPSVLPGAAQ